jgi:hypothetical protein
MGAKEKTLRSTLRIVRGVLGVLGVRNLSASGFRQKLPEKTGDFPGLKNS